jgi:hypothetical protein
MRFRARWSTRGTVLNGMRLRFGVAAGGLLCALATGGLRAAAQDARKTSQPETSRLRFQVVDSTNSRGVPQAAVTLVSWKKKQYGEEKKELDGKMDERGFVEFPQVDAQKFAITVTMKGYRSYWRWIRGPDRLKRLSPIKLEPWISAHH